MTARIEKPVHLSDPRPDAIVVTNGVDPYLDGGFFDVPNGSEKGRGLVAHDLAGPISGHRPGVDRQLSPTRMLHEGRLNPASAVVHYS